MAQMNCVGCGKPIDYEKSRNPRAFDFGTTNKHECEEFKNRPKKQFNFTKKEYKGQSSNLEILGLQSEIQTLKELVEKHDAAIRGLVQQVSFQKATEVEQTD